MSAYIDWCDGKMNYLNELEKLLSGKHPDRLYPGAFKTELALDYLYENRNEMTKDQFYDCIVAYGHFVYNEG